MEKIKSIEQLRAQRELLKVQQMIAELRVKKEMYELKKGLHISKNILPTINGLVRSGFSSAFGKQLLFSTATKFAARIFRKKSKV